MNEFLRRILFLPEQASTYSVRVDHLHYFVIITTFVASSMIGLAAVYWVIRWRRRPGAQTTERVVSSTRMEALIIGLPLAFFLLWFGIGFRDYVWLHDEPKDGMDVYVMAKQWMWKFSYPGGPSAIDRLTVPQGRPVRLLLTSRDMIHSFFVPAFRIKQDALPGRYTEIWFQAREVGTFDVLCAEYCGAGHSLMRAEVVVLKQTDYDAWLTEQRRGLAGKQDMGAPSQLPPIVEQGRLAAERHECLKCHSIDGSRHIGPTWVGLYGKQERLLGGETVIADEGYLTESMMDPAAKIVDGYQPVMPTYQGILSGPDAAAIVEYIKSLRGNQVHPGPSEGPVYEPERKR